MKAPIIVKLDGPASAAVRAYARLTRADPQDVVNAAVTDSTANVVEMLRPGPRFRDDSVDLVAEQVASARRRRLGEEPPEDTGQAECAPTDAPVNGTGPNPGVRDAASKPVPAVTLTFDAKALAALEVLRLHDGHDSLEGLIRHELAASVSCLFAAMNEPTLREAFFGPGLKED